MDTKVYITQKKYVAADGTVKYYPNSSKYTPVNKTEKPAKVDKPRQIRKKREGSVNSVVSEIKTLDKVNIEKVKKYIEELKNGTREDGKDNV
jgi:hypothetical protein